MTAKPVEIDLTPILEFKYIQISNFSFQYLLLGKGNKALHTPFECKDYLQDIFWSENTGNVSEIWGITWEPGRVNPSLKTYSLAMLGASDHKLHSRIPMMKSLLNQFETALGFRKTRISPSTHPDHIVVKFSGEWTQSPLLLSAFTTLIRISGMYEGENPVEYLKRLKSLKSSMQSVTNYMRHDVSRIESFINKLGALLQGIKPEKTWASLHTVEEAHDTGISACDEFPCVVI